MARCGCSGTGSGTCACSLTAGNNTTVTGAGTTGNPWVVNANVPCSDVRTCLTAGCGITYTAATGTIAARISATAGNTLQCNADGLFVPSGNNSVTTGCGITGTGLPASPLRVNTATWPYSCPPDVNGTVVTCDVNGQLRGAPEAHTYYFQYLEERSYPNLTVPTADDTVVDTFTFQIQNPDPCRSVRVLQWRDLDADFNMPPNSRAAVGISTDEMYNVWNTGSTTAFDNHAQVGKVTQPSASLAPGASLTLTLDATMAKNLVGGATGNATYNRLQASFRVWMMPV